MLVGFRVVSSSSFRNLGWLVRGSWSCVELIDILGSELRWRKREVDVGYMFVLPFYSLDIASYTN